jgi:hypothetical protein
VPPTPFEFVTPTAIKNAGGEVLIMLIGASGKTCNPCLFAGITVVCFPKDAIASSDRQTGIQISNARKNAVIFII